MIKAAYLRVYVPSPTAIEPTPPPAGEIILTDYGLITESLEESSLVTEWNDRMFVCPLHPRLRVLEGMLAFRDTYPGLTAELLVPEEIAQVAANELESLRKRMPQLRSHVQVSPWHVPLRWFAAFDPEERSFVNNTSVLYRTDVARAGDRLSRVLSVLRHAGFQEPVIEQVDELENWISSFPADGLLELDYGGVSNLFSDGQLALDETAADLQSSIEALEAGNLDEAGDHYARAAGRWAPAQALAYLN